MEGGYIEIFRTIYQSLNPRNGTKVISHTQRQLVQTARTHAPPLQTVWRGGGAAEPSP
jgi:hypothetical protein